MKQRFLTIFFLILTLNPLYSENAKVYLVTIGPGDDIFLRWGHFAILVDYQDAKRDLLFDYGNFSFAQDDFIKNFLKGVMTYSKYRKAADYELQNYAYENRDITLQELNLTQEQIDQYIEKLFSEIKPENRDYQYDHYYNNCVSQMSDFLDDLTDGEFYKGTTKYTGRSFRDLTRDYVSSNYFNNLLIMFVLGSKVDFNITEKQAMFLPDYTMLRADNVKISDGEGGFKPLVINKIVVNKSEGRDPVILNSKPKIVLNLILGLIIALTSLYISKFKKLSYTIQIILGLVLAIVGSLLFFMSFFTGHYYIHNNWNLLMVNPMFIFIFISGIIKFTKHKAVGYKMSSIFIDSTLILIIFMIVLKIIGLMNQGNGEIIALFAPIFLVHSSFKYLILDKDQDGSSIS